MIESRNGNVRKDKISGSTIPLAETNRQTPSNIKKAKTKRDTSHKTNEVEAAQELPNTMMTRSRRCVIENAASAAARMATRSAIAMPKI